MASATVTSRILLLALTTIFGWSLANAQSLKLGAKVGALYLVSNESGSAEDIYIKQSGFGFGPWAPSVGMELRYTPPRGRLTFALDASYSWLTGDGTMSWLESVEPHLWGEGEFKSSLYIVSAGLQWNVLPGPVQPYLGARVLWTHMAEVEQGSRIAPIAEFNHIGVGFLAGATIELTSPLALDVCARYNLTSVSDPGPANEVFDDFFIGVGLLFEVL